MSSEDKLGKNPAPSAIRYLVLFGAFTSLITALAFFPAISGASTEEQNFYNSAIPGFTFLFIISILEWFLLRRSRKMFGPYGFAIAVEIIKTILLNFATAMHIQSVDGASSSAFLLLQLTSLAILFMLALTKIAQTNAWIERLAEKDISRNLLNLLPTFLVLILFMGTYVAELAGLGTPRQRSSFEPYEEKQINWDMFSTPSWDATYLLENLLDQFTAGLRLPDKVLFNITSDQTDSKEPPVYWRIGSLETYQYTNKPPYSTDWDPSDSFKRVLSPEKEIPNSTYSHILSDTERTASFTVHVPVDYSSSQVDASVHPSFINQIPTTWNGPKGSYVSSNSFSLYSNYIDAQDERNSLSLSKSQVREIFPNSLTKDLLGIDTNVLVDESDTSEQVGVLAYTMDYSQPDIQSIAAYSLLRTQYNECVDPTTWAAIEDLYLQLPDRNEGTMPSSGNVHGVPDVNLFSYSDWAPFLTGNASEWNDSGLSVFAQAYANMQKFGNQSNFRFNETVWLSGQLLGENEVVDHPEEREDYNEWFFRRFTPASGVSLHFASAYATIMRLQGIPSRVVIGYLAGNDSDTYSPYRAITSRFLHAWAEVLVPVDTLPLISGGEQLEWVSFDPLLSYLASQYGIELPPDIVPTSSDNQTLTIRPDYDLENKGLANAYIDHSNMQPDDWVFGRVITNLTANYDPLVPSTFEIADGETVELSLRLISYPSLATWLPYQNANISFYLGIEGENESGIFVDWDLTDSTGVATVEFTGDITTYGIRTIYFFATVEWSVLSTETKAALSFAYNLVFI